MNVRTQTIILLTVAGLIVIGCMAAVIVKACEPTPAEPTESVECVIVSEEYKTLFEYDDNGVTRTQSALAGHTYHIFKVKVTNTGDKTVKPLLSWFRFDATGTTAGNQMLGIERVMGMSDYPEGIIYKYDPTAADATSISTGESVTMTLVFDGSDSHNYGTLYTYIGAYKEVKR